jgi:hypothetical protein
MGCDGSEKASFGLGVAEGKRKSKEGLPPRCWNCGGRKGAGLMLRSFMGESWAAWGLGSEAAKGGGRGFGWC